MQAVEDITALGKRGQMTLGDIADLLSLPSFSSLQTLVCDTCNGNTDLSPIFNCPAFSLLLSGGHKLEYTCDGI